MAHRLLYEFVTDLTRALELPAPVVEFGAMQVEEGQPNDLRPLFAQSDFIGTDFREGPGVDRVEDLRGLTFDDGSIGTALCLDTLEHCADPLMACREMHRVLVPGGICVITSVMLVGIHAHPSDYWRFTPEGFRLLLEPFDDLDVASVGEPTNPFFVFGVGTKGKPLGLEIATLPSLVRAQESYERAQGKVRLGPFRYSLRELGASLRSELPRVLRQRAEARLSRQRGQHS
jgi:SAM-dependent methyltransferase